ncbi:hypothetical protein [Bradyrhizobium sp.]|uniref:hypothetical protein n=1 Tax=Bradyrhizobium sp. TaxID=376 RepID=UPI0026191645|nr:hypothetical protein [Bradyrhizobium sp.]
MSADYHANRLYRVAMFVKTGSGASDEDRARFVADVGRYFADQCSIEDALGLRLDKGENHPAFSLKLARRNDALRAAAAMLGAATPANARKIADWLKGYRSNGWLRDRDASVCPHAIRGRIEAHLWVALKARDHLIDWKQIQKVIGTPMELISASEFQGGG